MENYEKAYKEALERAKEIKDTKGCGLKNVTNVCETIFPELCESEDERIRKNCIHFLELQKKHHAATFEIEECISWLEKQGENVTPQWMIDFLKEHRRHFAMPMDYDEKQETDGKLLTVIKWLEGNPQLEQKTTWSEEDEKMLSKLIKHFEWKDTEYRFTKEDCLEATNWLKSLKPQLHWKPSEEQMQALFEAKLASINNREYFLGLLYEDLKKL